MNDLSSDIHRQLDEEFRSFSGFNVDKAAHTILFNLLGECSEAYADIWPLDSDKVSSKACKDHVSREVILNVLRTAHRKGEYVEVRRRPEFHKKWQELPSEVYFSYFEAGQRLLRLNFLREAYNTPFQGTVVVNFVEFLRRTDREVRENETFVYAKALPVVQGSASGKSRLLTETGSLIFTLPVCIRRPGSPGYPLSDELVHRYISDLDQRNELSTTGHIAIACLIGAAHTTMLSWLQRAQATHDAIELHKYWHTLMERSESRSERDSFFAEVVALANSMKNKVTPAGTSPRQNKEGQPDRMDFDVESTAKRCYNSYAKQATENLVKFVAALSPQNSLLVTYFDEAHELELLFWILLRLLTNQDKSVSMWYVFMGTKPSLSYFRPPPDEMFSLRLRAELERLLSPYFALGFDQNVICSNRALVTVTMGTLQSIEHLSKYGRPVWKAQFRKGEEDELLALAALKLANGAFNSKNKDHVLAVLSQRICVDTVMASSEAIELANRSVANHMRFLTGISDDNRTFYTYSPSEPLLTLGAIEILYSREDNDLLGQVLDTFSRTLCDAGLVEKGLLGELGGRTLLLLARDFAAPKKEKGFGRDLLKPVLLINFLDKLFGNKTWCAPHRAGFEAAFVDTYINFTHWIVTKDNLPKVPSQQLLGNLWSRGAALQCCFNQDSLDLMVVIYKGSIAADAVFDVANLSGGVFQLKYKGKADTKAEPALRPIGIPRHIHQPLPYFAVVMELGNESYHRQPHSKIKVTLPPPLADGTFEKLWEAWMSAVCALDVYRAAMKLKKKRKRGGDAQETELLEKVKDAQMAMDAYNRFSISVRGASPEMYGILQEANVVAAFAGLLKVTMPSPPPEDPAVQHMRPLECLSSTSAHTAWMSEFGTVHSEDEEMDMDA